MAWAFQVLTGKTDPVQYVACLGFHERVVDRCADGLDDVGCFLLFYFCFENLRSLEVTSFEWYDDARESFEFAWICICYLLLLFCFFTFQQRNACSPIHGIPGDFNGDSSERLRRFFGEMILFIDFVTHESNCNLY